MMLFVRILNEACNRRIEALEAVVIPAVKASLFYEFPETFYEIQIGRIRRKKKQFYSEFFRMPPYPIATLVFCIVKHYRFGLFRSAGKLVEHFTDRL